MFFPGLPRLLSIPTSTGLDRDDFVRVARQLLPRCVFSPETVTFKPRNFQELSGDSRDRALESPQARINLGERAQQLAKDPTVKPED